MEEQHDQIKFIRVDSELDETSNDDKSELTGQDGETKSEKIRKIFKSALNNEKITIKVQSLKGENSPPALILLPEQMRRINDIGALMEQRLPGLPEHHVLVVNISHKIINGLAEINAGSILLGDSSESISEALSNDLAKHLYEMALLGVGGLEANEILGFQHRSSNLMGRLIEKAL